MIINHKQMSDFNFFNSKGNNKLFSPDRILLLIVLLLGISGLVFLLNMKKEPVLITEKEKALPELPQKKIENPIKNSIPTETIEINNQTSNAKLNIKGELEVGQPLQFSISNLEQNVDYIIDFGNGTKKNINSPNISYAYSKSGKYSVSIKAIYNGQTKIVDSKIINIANEIEIVQKAND